MLTLEALLPDFHSDSSSTTSTTTLAILGQNHVDCSFLIHHFLVSQLKVTRRRVLIISFSQIFGHYAAIGRKLGLNLVDASRRGQLYFIDACSRLTRPHLQGHPFPLTSAKPQAAFSLDTSSASSNTLNPLLLIIEKQIAQWQNEPYSILVDDLSILLDVGVHIKDVVTFMRQLRQLVVSRKGCLIFGTQTTFQEDLPDVRLLARALIQQSHVILQGRALSTGRSRQVDGQLSILRGPLLHAKSNIQPQQLHFKLIDNGFRLYAKGLSQGLV